MKREEMSVKGVYGINKHGLRETKSYRLFTIKSTLLPQSALGSGRNTRNKSKENENLTRTKNYTKNYCPRLPIYGVFILMRDFDRFLQIVISLNMLIVAIC